MTLRGPDVSLWQGYTIDWKAVAASGASFAIAKATEGTGYADPTFARNWASIASAGLVRGAYHFARPDLGTTAVDEATWFLSHLPPLETGDLVVLDMEVPTGGPGNQNAWALQWLQHVEGQLHCKPLLYTGQWYAVGLGRLTEPALSTYPLWNAAYGPPPAPPAYLPWTQVTLWQHTQTASYPSIGQCDESLFEGALQELRALGCQGRLPQGHSTPHYEVVTATHFRPTPVLNAVPLGPLLPVGTRVVELPPPPPLPIETTHWAYCRTSGDVHGYLYKPDLKPYAP